MKWNLAGVNLQVDLVDVAGEDVVDHVAGIPHVVEDPLIKQGVEAHPVVGDNQEAFQIEAHVVVDQEAFQIEEEVDQGEWIVAEEEVFQTVAEEAPEDERE